MKRIYLLFCLCFLSVIHLFSQDKCTPVGFVISDSVVTGGGNQTPVTVTTFEEFKAQAESIGPKVIYVQGEIGTGTRGKTGDVAYITSNKTIIGYAGAKLKGSLRVYDQSNVIVRNLVIQGLGSTESQGYDCMTIKNSSRVWVDHCEFRDGEDGNMDIIRGSDLVSVTWCIFRYTTGGIHNLSNNIGASENEPESIDKLRVTFQYCWWDGCVQRMPRVRYGKVHIANCLFTNGVGVPPSTGAVAAGKMANIRVENSYFMEIANPIRIKEDTENAVIVERNNLFIGCSGRTSSNSVGTPPLFPFMPPYNLDLAPAEKVESIVSNRDCGAGATMDSPTQCGCEKISKEKKNTATKKKKIFSCNGKKTTEK